MIITIHLKRKENIDYYQKEIINIDIEEYLRGVVSAEIGNADIEACKAQAVAARTFALIKHSNGKQLTDQSSVDQAFRISKTSSSYPNASLAIEETKGQVLYYNNKLINTCPYSNSNGGYIKSSQERWGGKRAWLQSKDDPYDNGSGNGHGVGMSQVGAKTMAGLGFTYKDILSFYYPGTEIKNNYGQESEEQMATRPELMVNYAKSKIGCGYVWGASGQIANESNLQALHKLHPSEVNLSIVRKWIGTQIFDCASLVRLSTKAAGIEIYGGGATKQWDKKSNWESSGTIDTLPKDKVCCLYRRSTKDSSKMQHTGVYLGNGTFIDAAGSSTGVRGPVSMSKYAWTHWAIPKGLYDGTEIKEPEVIKVAYQAKVTATSGQTVNMRESASTSSKVLTPIAIGQIVDVTGTTGSWSQIVWNGKSGYMMSKYLTKVDGSESNKVWYVKLECNSETQAKAIAQILAKAQATT